MNYCGNKKRMHMYLIPPNTSNPVKNLTITLFRCDCKNKKLPNRSYDLLDYLFRFVFDIDPIFFVLEPIDEVLVTRDDPTLKLIGALEILFLSPCNSFS